MSELQKCFEKEYRAEHNIPDDMELKTIMGGNQYAAFEIQTAWSMYCKGFTKGVEWNSALNNFMECAK